MKTLHIRGRLLPAAALILCAGLLLNACGKKKDGTVQSGNSFQEVISALQSAENETSSAASAETENAAQAAESAETSVTTVPDIQPPPPVIHADGTIDGGGDVTLDIDPSYYTGGTTADNPGTSSAAPVGNTFGNIAGNYAASSATLGETEDMGQEYLDSIIFLGDSTTYGLRYYAMLSGGKDTTQVWTPSSGTLTLSYQSVATILYPETNTEIPIRDAVELKKPAYMVITLGVNGISFMDGDYFKSEYTDLVRGIQARSPDTKIILQSIFPVASSYEYMSSINNDKIAAANQWVIEVAEQTGCRYLATSSALIGSDGFLPDSYQNGDGLHLDTSGFNIVVNYIRTHGYK